MARIRTIKPEFPQSESMGRVSRDARLTFLELWTLADDAGRLRGNSRMLASLLFPYDDDAPALIDTWLEELTRENCIQRYQVGGDSYIQICNWLIHQKIDHASQSKIPEFDKPREPSRRLAVGSRTKGPKDQGPEDQGLDQGGEGKHLASADADAPNPLNAETWKAYKRAYQHRYGAPPVRNKTVNSKIKLFVERIGIDSPAVAAYYVGCQMATYVRDTHGVGLMLRDAEGLRTQWATGRNVTQTQALQADKTEARGSVFRELIEEAHEAAT